MEEGSEGVSDGPPKAMADVTDRNADMIVDALSTTPTTSTTVSDDNIGTSDAQNNDVSDCAMTEGKFNHFYLRIIINEFIKPISQSYFYILSQQLS